MDIQTMAEMVKSPTNHRLLVLLLHEEEHYEMYAEVISEELVTKDRRFWVADTYELIVTAATGNAYSVNPRYISPLRVVGVSNINRPEELKAELYPLVLEDIKKLINNEQETD